MCIPYHSGHSRIDQNFYTNIDLFYQHVPLSVSLAGCDTKRNESTLFKEGKYLDNNIIRHVNGSCWSINNLLLCGPVKVYGILRAIGATVSAYSCLRTCTMA